ncbi:MAG: flagellar motor switch protein FliG [Deltaproteobacteria bacterium]|nr:flagellar motor switch protein FliG [Deltaproteobacteria bacterium]
MAINELKADKLSGPQKAAIFLLTMGENFTNPFFQELDEQSIKKIGKYMSEISYIPSDVLDAVMKDFLESFENDNDLVVSGKDFLQQVVKKTLDDETAREVFKVIGDESGEAPFSDLAYMPADGLSKILMGEHPQTIALILSYLPEGKAAEILNILPDDIKPDVAFRVSNVGQVQDEFVKELDQAIKSSLSTTKVTKRKFDGVVALANILNEVDGKTEEKVLSHLEEQDSDLADRVRQKMFVFEDLLGVDDKNFRDILQNVDNQQLAKALKTASEELKQKIFHNLSERASEMLKEDIDVMGPVRLTEVEEAQQTILKAAKKLEAEGKIVLAGKGKEDVLV